MKRPFLLAAATCAGLATLPAVPAAAQFEDQVAVTRMRSVPRSAEPSALASRLIAGFSERTIDAFEAAPAIVVAPSGMTDAEREEFGRTFRATSDGYFARLTGDDHDVVINGTLAYSVAPASVRFQRITGAYRIQKAEGETGLAFQDFGGDYLLQFICHSFVEGQDGGCVTDEEAVAFYNRIVPLGGGLE